MFHVTIRFSDFQSHTQTKHTYFLIPHKVFLGCSDWFLCYLAHVCPSVTISRKPHPYPIKFTLIFTTSLQHNNTLQNKCMLISRWRKAKRTVHTKKFTSISAKHKICPFQAKSVYTHTNQKPHQPTNQD